MDAAQIRLKALLQQRHWQTHRTFCREYDRAAKAIDPALAGSWPSRAQLHRWLTGDLKGLPYPDHCRVLERMFAPWTAAQLFAVGSVDSADAESVAVPAVEPKMDVFVDMNEEDNRLIAQRIRHAKSISFVAHTGYAVMVSQYQAAMRHAAGTGCALRVVVSNPDGALMNHAELTRRLCPSIRQAGEITDVLDACRRHFVYASSRGHPADNVQARLYNGPPSMNMLLVDDWLRIIPYLPLVDAAESPVFEFPVGQHETSPLVSKFLMSFERLWDDSTPVDLLALPGSQGPTLPTPWETKHVVG